MIFWKEDPRHVRPECAVGVHLAIISYYSVLSYKVSLLLKSLHMYIYIYIYMYICIYIYIYIVNT